MESQHPIMVLNDQYRLRTRLISIESQPKKIVVVVVIGVVVVVVHVQVWLKSGQ